MRLFLRQDHGNATVEMALSYMLAFTLLLGVMEFTMMAYTFAAVSEATRDGLHYATLHGTDSSTCSGPTTGCADTVAANVVSDVTTFLARFSRQANALSVAVSYPEASSAPPALVTITTTYTYRPLFGLAGFARTFHSTTQGRIVY